LGVTGTRLIKLDQVPNGNPVELDMFAGEIGSPKWLFNTRTTYTNGPFTFSWQLRYVGKGEFNIQDNPVETTDPQGFGATTYSDVQARMKVSDQFTAYFGVNNLFDNQPPRGSRQSTATATVLFDQVGRYLYAGIEAKF
jgi:iron complex outermembrane recepter protein